MILAYFILAHLLADFILQPSKLVKWKMKSAWGTLTHVLIHFFTNFIILLPFIVNGYSWLVYVIFAICIIHFIIDEAKINYDLKHDEKVKPFVMDQLLHILTLIVANYFLLYVPFALPNNIFYQIYGNIDIIIFLSFLVIISTVIEVYNLQKQREKNKNVRLKINSDHMLTRVIIFTLIYAFSMFIVFVLAGF